MATILNVDAVQQYNAGCQVETLHPLVSVIDFSTIGKRKKPVEESIRFGFYAVFLKEDNQQCEIRYGRNRYDYQQGTLVFIAPGQVTTVSRDQEEYQPTGHVLLFHPDLLRGTLLAQAIHDYSFFSYSVHEALHLSQQEREVVLECFRKIDYELRHAIDKHSKKLIVSNIELFLNYCTRFYDRQFITRDTVHSGVLERFEERLQAYFRSGKPQETGLPSVAHFANELHLSANYFGDLIKKETGKTAQEWIQAKVMDLAKEKIYDRDKTVSQIAYELGFKYPQHFTRFFKQQAGNTPNEFRNGLN